MATHHWYSKCREKTLEHWAAEQEGHDGRGDRGSVEVYNNMGGGTLPKVSNKEVIRMTVEEITCDGCYVWLETTSSL